MTDPTDFDDAYVAGLLDATARVRFDLTEQPDDEFTVRPTLRIAPHASDMREAVVGQFLEEGGYDYDFVTRDRGADFFLLQQRSDLERLRASLAGESAQLGRELAFVTGPFADRFDTSILDPVEACRFLKARDELRFGWRPRGINFRTLAETAERFGVDADELAPVAIPDGDLRSDYSVEWMAGLFDGLGRYRPSIAQSSEYALGYGMHPVVRLHRGGVHPTLVDHVRRFCDDHDLDVGDASERTRLKVTFTGPANIRRLLDVLFPRLLVLAEHSELMLDSILPRFDRNVDHTEPGFVRLLEDFDAVARASGGPFRERTFTPDYFADLWADELERTADGD